MVIRGICLLCPDCSGEIKVSYDEQGNFYLICENCNVRWRIENEKDEQKGG